MPQPLNSPNARHQGRPLYICRRSKAARPPQYEAEAAHFHRQGDPAVHIWRAGRSTPTSGTNAAGGTWHQPWAWAGLKGCSGFPAADWITGTKIREQCHRIPAPEQESLKRHDGARDFTSRSYELCHGLRGTSWGSKIVWKTPRRDQLAKSVSTLGMFLVVPKAGTAGWDVLLPCPQAVCRVKKATSLQE